MDDQERYERGMAKRRKVLGNAWVDQANTEQDPLQFRISGSDHALSPGARSGRARISTSARGASW